MFAEGVPHDSSTLEHPLLCLLQTRERELVASAAKNPYELALLLTQMAPFQAERHQQAAMLQVWWWACLWVRLWVWVWIWV